MVGIQILYKERRNYIFVTLIHFTRSCPLLSRVSFASFRLRLIVQTQIRLPYSFLSTSSLLFTSRARVVSFLGFPSLPPPAKSSNSDQPSLQLHLQLSCIFDLIGLCIFYCSNFVVCGNFLYLFTDVHIFRSISLWVWIDFIYLKLVLSLDHVFGEKKSFIEAAKSLFPCRWGVLVSSILFLICANFVYLFTDLHIYRLRIFCLALMKPFWQVIFSRYILIKKKKSYGF